MANPQAPFQERFIFKGVDLTNPPDAIPPGKVAAAQNVRANPAASTLYTRPGSTQVFAANNTAVTDIRAFATLGTDDNPRILARDTQNRIYLDTGNLQTTLGANGFGVRMIPFRPNQSPQSFMYVYANNNAAKLQAPPDSVNNCTVTNIGIAEPQNEAEFSPSNPLFTAFTNVAATWANTGTAGAPSDTTRSNENIGAALADLVRTTRYSLQPAANGAYQVGEVLNLLDANNASVANAIVQLVLAPLAAGNTMNVLAIRYDSGSNGLCTVVPSQVPLEGASQIGSLQRGSLIQFVQGGTNEVALVLSATPGPGGGVSIRTSTNNSFNSTATLNGIPAIVVDANVSLANATHMTANAVNWAANAASNNNFALLTQTLATNPFAVSMGNNTLPQEDDYIHFSLNVDNPAALTEIKLQFNVDATDNTFTQNVLYYSVRPSDLVNVTSGNQTQLSAIQGGANAAQITAGLQSAASLLGMSPQDYQNLLLKQAQLGIQNANELAAAIPGGAGGASSVQSVFQQLAQNISLAQFGAPPDQTVPGNNQWTEIMVPISGLTRIGNDLTKTLANCRAVQVFVNCNNNINMRLSSIWVGGGYQPDTGDAGAPYQYRVVPRNQTTGAKGNPSPVPVYGMFSRRQPITVSPPSLAYDSQIDVYDVFRYGGSVTSWRYIGSQAVGNNFVDNFTDDAARVGDLIELDNFQPWPSVDVPFKANNSGSNTIVLNGTIVIVTLTGGATWPASTNNWLPGTLIQINNQSAYPLWARPVSLGGNAYLFKFGQTTGSGNASTFWVNEPLVANQQNPWTWGPDARGTVFGVGDPNRPGTVSFTKPNNPDSAPDKFNLDLCPPSEPLLGGEIVSGVSLCASTQRWWGLYPAFNSADTPYEATERNVGRGLLTPYGHTTDGTKIYFWGRDGIYATAGEAAKSLTDDLYPIFPHDGIPGSQVARNSVTYFPPDYSRAAQFRLVYTNSLLYAIYPDSNNTYRTLVLDLRTMAWSQDNYATAMSGAYAVEQQEGTIVSASNNSYPLLYMGLVNGKVNKQTALTNDNVVLGLNGSNGTGVSGVIQTREWDGGPQVLNGLWRDPYVDALAPNGMNVTPMTLNAPSGNTTAISPYAFRRLSQVPQDPGTVQRFCGVEIKWTDTY